VICIMGTAKELGAGKGAGCWVLLLGALGSGF